jgi:uncharacterized protein
MKEEEIKNLHKKFVHGEHKEVWYDIVWTHSNIVLKVAKKISCSLKERGFLVNDRLLKDGILLHDIGTYKCFDQELNNVQDAPPFIKHGILGYEILRNEGVNDSIARFAKTHTGVGLTIQDIEKGDLPLPKEDMIPITLEEEILCYADKFHNKYPSFSNFENQKKHLSKYSDESAFIMDRFKIKFGIPDIKDLIDEYEPWNEKIDKFLSKF